jgi:hypothetical protein
MNELKLVSKTTAAIVTFNYAEIDAQLDEVLKKYGGLLFTDETVAECKKTIAELKNGKKSLNDFRIKTKKLLTKDITKFEDQCKLLSNKFDTVIEPISEQADAFEVTRKANKEAEIIEIINKLSTERALEGKYGYELAFTDSMLNKGTTIKSIKEDLTKLADSLLSQQNMEKANIELIKSKVELANAQYGVTLLNDLYLNFLEDGENVTSIVSMINENAEKTKIKAEEAESERLEIEARKVERLAQQEADRLARIAQRELDRVASEARQAEREVSERINQERQAMLREHEKAKVTVVPPIVEVADVLTEKVWVDTEEQSLPIKDIQSEVFVENYKVDGTEAELNALEDFLNTNQYTWSIING